MTSPYRSPKTFKLKPYQNKSRGRERVITGILLLCFALFNLYLTSVDGLISLLFAVFFGWSGVRNISLGIRLGQAPQKDRAYRVSTQGLFKVLEGRELARLDLREVKAIWFSSDQHSLSIMTSKGVETITKDELELDQEWEIFTTWLERSITEVIYRDDPRLWQELQQQSEAMSSLGERRFVGAKMMMLALFVGAGVYYYQMQFHLPFFLQAGRSDLLSSLIGAPSSFLLSDLENLYRVFSGIVIPTSGLSLIYDLFVLYWVGRTLEPLWGTWRLFLVYFSGYLFGLLAVLLLDSNALYIGSHGASIALCTSAYLWNGLGIKRKQMSAMPEILKRAKTSSFILLLVFVMTLGFETSPTYVQQLSWLVSAGIGALFAWLFGRSKAYGRAWILSDGDRFSGLSAIMAGTIPVGSLVFGFMAMIEMNHQSDYTYDIARYTPIAQIELGQRCTGAPLEELSPLPKEAIEAIPPLKRCSQQTLNELSDSLERLSRFYPQLPPKQYSPTVYQAHPQTPLVRALHRALILNHFGPNDHEALLDQLRSDALKFPLDLYGEMLAAVDKTLDREASLEESPEGAEGTQIQLNTRKGLVTFELSEGVLTWEIKEQAKEHQTHQGTKLKTLTDLIWLRVRSPREGKGDLSHLLSFTLPSQFKASAHPKQRRKLRIIPPDEITKGETLSLDFISHEEVTSDSPKSLGSTQARLYSWSSPPRFARWVAKRISAH